MYVQLHLVSTSSTSLGDDRPEPLSITVVTQKSACSESKPPVPFSASFHPTNRVTSEGLPFHSCHHSPQTQYRTDAEDLFGITLSGGGSAFVLITEPLSSPKARSMSLINSSTSHIHSRRKLFKYNPSLVWRGHWRGSHGCDPCLLNFQFNCSDLMQFDIVSVHGLISFLSFFFEHVLPAFPNVSVPCPACHEDQPKLSPSFSLEVSEQECVA